MSAAGDDEAVGLAGAEWLEADGRGGFASGPVLGARTRRYHALLSPALLDGRRFVLVAGLDVEVVTPVRSYWLSAQRYAGGVEVGGQGALEHFTTSPSPTWVHRLPDGTRIETAIVAEHGRPATAIGWRRLAGSGQVSLRVRPLLAGRDHHALHHENPDFRFAAQRVGLDRLVVSPYLGVPDIVMAASGSFVDDAHWYRGFEYTEELRRGFPGSEDLAVPGFWQMPLGEAGTGRATLVLAAAGDQIDAELPTDLGAAAWAEAIFAREGARRAAFAHPLDRAADAYVFASHAGHSIIAGYPWFTDWGRDTFISLRGLLLATGRLQLARAVLLRWAAAVSRGMLPNRFLRVGEAPEYNAVDAAFWFVIVVDEYLHKAKRAGGAAAAAAEAARATLLAAVRAVIEGHLGGTRHQIAVTPDGLLQAGVPGLQLTWMDAKVDDWVVTPRIGKPVEIQALWLNALGIAIELCDEPKWMAIYDRGQLSFGARFWDPAHGGLYDVVDVDHRPGVVDGRVRPNQIFAAGGLPRTLLRPAQARAVVDQVEARLWVPLGVRTLAPGEPQYQARYAGSARVRDGAYHQGTAWPWLLGPFVQAWVSVRGGGAAVKREARVRFLRPLEQHLRAAGIGHISEIVDAEPPHRPGGCPFQAWSLGEFLRLDRVVLADD